MRGLIFVLSILLISGEVFAGYGIILLYHRFGDDRYPTTSVSLEDFEAQMRYLKENGYRVVPLKELLRLIREGRNIPEKTVAITIDDGYRSTMKAFTILKKYGYPFTVFLYMEAVGRYPDFLTLEDIREMERYGKVDFGNHSYSHRAFGLMKNRKFFLEDLERSEERFKELFGRKPELYALPYGYYNKEILKVLKERGYTAVLTQDPGNAGPFTDLLRVSRQAIVGSWSRMGNFKKKLSREPLPLGELVPGYGFIENPPERIGAVLLFPKRYGSCRIYITELGWRIAKREGDFVFRDDFVELKRRWNRIGVKCKNVETGRWAESFWMIIKDWR